MSYGCQQQLKITLEVHLPIPFLYDRFQALFRIVGSLRGSLALCCKFFALLLIKTRRQSASFAAGCSHAVEKS